MDNHPIPQDITGFQFKLIGDMTIKQFAYLATGSVMAWISFSLPAPFFVKIPFTTIFIFLGVGFAFLSIEGRPVDTMIKNFIKATFSPTQYIYQAASEQSQISSVRQAQDKSQMPGERPTPITPASHFYAKKAPSKLDEKEFDFFRMLSQIFEPQTQPVQKQQVTGPVRPRIINASSDQKEKEEREEEGETSASTPEPELKTLEHQSEILEEELQKLKVEETKDKGTASFEDVHKKVLEVEKLLSETQAQKQALEKEIMELRNKLEQQEKEVLTAGAPVARRESQNVRVVPKELGRQVGLPIAPDFPNIITGIIKDPRGNPLQNILVEVKDRDGNPVRAFKTNALGQFSASTPLVNGEYTIEFDDPTNLNKFEVIGFKAEGDIILPIEIISKDLREELRQSLFKN